MSGYLGPCLGRCSTVPVVVAQMERAHVVDGAVGEVACVLDADAHLPIALEVRPAFEIPRDFADLSAARETAAHDALVHSSGHIIESATHGQPADGLEPEDLPARGERQCGGRSKYDMLYD